jgi:hypothetical protein
MMETHEEFTKWAIERGVKINGIKPHKFEGRGLGIIAETDFEVRGSLFHAVLLCVM